MTVKRNTRPPKTTVIADDTAQATPQTTSAGDAPADTYSASERVSSARPDKAAAAAAGHLTVNAVEPVASVPTAVVSGNRTEVVTTTGPTGTTVTRIHDYDQGTSAAATTHAVSTALTAGVYIVEGGKVYQVTEAGSTASSKPTFNAAAVGDTITDGTVEWTRRT